MNIPQNRGRLTQEQEQYPMRDLTSKQKKFLLAWANNHEHIMRTTHDYVKEMDSEDWEALEAMNDTEVLYQNVNRFLDDLEWHWQYVPIEKVTFSLS